MMIVRPSWPAPVVVDASALVERLLATRRGRAVAQAAGSSPLVAPDHINVEVISALRGLERGGHLGPERSREALEDLRDAPLRRVPTLWLLPTAWRLRQNMSPYDALFVALADALECTLITGDRRLQRAASGAVAIVTV